MKTQIRSIRPFIGASDFNVSRRFYRDLGFEETELGPGMSVFRMQEFSFYLQDAYVKDWVDNTMIFMEVENTETLYEELLSLNLPEKYEGARLTPIRDEPWGRECFLHDPSGILWHFGQFRAE